MKTTAITIYDNGNKTIDSITIVYNNTASLPLFKSKNKDYECIAASYNGVAFFQHSNCQKWRHLGKKIEFSQLHEDLQKMLIDEFFTEGVQLWRKPTPGELKFGYGAIHYKTFTPELIGNKKSIICPVDGLRYYI